MKTTDQEKKKSGSPRSERNVSVDLTPQQKNKLKSLADKSDMKLSEYLRAVVATAIDDQPIFQRAFRRVNGGNRATAEA